MNPVIFFKIEFTKQGKLLLTIDNTTLPDALTKARKLKPLNNPQINIQCYYK